MRRVFFFLYEFGEIKYSKRETCRVEDGGLETEAPGSRLYLVLRRAVRPNRPAKPHAPGAAGVDVRGLYSRCRHSGRLKTRPRPHSTFPLWHCRDAIVAT